RTAAEQSDTMRYAVHLREVSESSDSRRPRFEGVDGCLRQAASETDGVVTVGGTDIDDSSISLLANALEHRVQFLLIRTEELLDPIAARGAIFGKAQPTKGTAANSRAERRRDCRAARSGHAAGSEDLVLFRD